MSHKSSRFLIIIPIVCIVIPVILAIQKWELIALTIPFVIADIIGSIFYASQPAPTCYDEAVKSAAYNKWIKLTNLLADVAMIVLHIYLRNVRGYILDRIFLLDLSYLIARLFSQFATYFILVKIVDSAKNIPQIQFQTKPLHFLLHLIPVADIFSVLSVNKQLNHTQ